MKKSLFTITTALLSTLILFSGCENFLAGSNLKKELDEQISVANAPVKSVRINVINPEIGTINQEGLNDFKVGLSYNLSITVNKNFKFEKWVALNKKDLEKYYKSSSEKFNFIYTNDEDSTTAFEQQYKDKYISSTQVYFENQYNPETKVTLKEELTDIVIVPLCWKRPQITNFSNDDSTYMYDPERTIILQFDHPLSEKLLIPACIYNSNRNEKTYINIVNPEYITITAKESKEALTGKNAIGFYKAIINKDQLKLVSLASDYAYSAYYNGGYSYYSYSLDDMTDSNGNSYFTELSIKDPFLSAQKDYGITRYLEISVKANTLDKYGITMADDKVFTCKQGYNLDKEPPVLTDVRFYLPESRHVKYAGYHRGGYNKNLSTDKGNYTTYQYSDLLYDKETVYDKIKNSSDDFNNFFNYLRLGNQRIKNYINLYVRAMDSNASDIEPENSSNVKSMNFGFYNICDATGKVNTDFTYTDYYSKVNFKSLTPYKYSNSNNSVSPETQLAYVDYTTYHYYYDKTLEDYGNFDFSSLLTNNKGILEQFKLTPYSFDTFNDGLYCLEVYAKDYQENHPLEDISITTPNYNASEDYVKAHNINSYSKTGDQFSKYKAQLWFIKDTTAPDVSASAFTFDKKFSPTTINDLYIKKDHINNDETQRKILDKGDKRFRSIDTYRICKILPVSEASNWTVTGFEEKGWKLTYGSDADYVFNDIYSDEEWLPSDFVANPDKYAIYSYVKDDVGNISSQIKIDNASWYDGIAPTMTSNKLSDTGGTGVKLSSIKEEHSGIKKIHYDIKSENGTEYDIMKIYIYPNFKKADGSNFTQAYYKPGDNIYTVDSENNVLIFNNEIFPTTSSSNLEIYVSETKDYSFNGSSTTAKIWLEDAAGNESQVQTVTLK